MEIEKAQRVKKLLNNKEELEKFRSIMIPTRENFRAWIRSNNDGSEEDTAMYLTPAITKCIMDTLNNMILDIEEEIDKL